MLTSFLMRWNMVIIFDNVKANVIKSFIRAAPDRGQSIKRFRHWSTFTICPRRLMIAWSRECLDKLLMDAKWRETLTSFLFTHDDVIKWKHFPRYWPFVQGIHRLPVNSPHKGQWRGALMFPLICARINGWVSNGEDGDLRRHNDVTVIPFDATRT